VLDDASVFERCFQHIDDFASEGLRTLLFGYRFLDEQEYDGKQCPSYGISIVIWSIFDIWVSTKSRILIVQNVDKSFRS
jgi:magnesium-transporting ATPase (P-type)